MVETAHGKQQRRQARIMARKQRELVNATHRKSIIIIIRHNFVHSIVYKTLPDDSQLELNANIATKIKSNEEISAI